MYTALRGLGECIQRIVFALTTAADMRQAPTYCSTISLFICIFVPGRQTSGHDIKHCMLLLIMVCLPFLNLFIYLILFFLFKHLVSCFAVLILFVTFKTHIASTVKFRY